MQGDRCRGVNSAGESYVCEAGGGDVAYVWGGERISHTRRCRSEWCINSFEYKFTRRHY